MRDMDKNPYSKDEQRVAKFFFERGTGGGDDPIEALIIAYQYLVHDRNELRQEIAALKAAHETTKKPKPEEK